MFLIKAPVPFTGKSWSLSFVDGMAKTENSYLANKLSNKGYSVTKQPQKGRNQNDNAGKN